MVDEQFIENADVAAEMAGLSFSAQGLHGVTLVFPEDSSRNDPRIYPVNLTAAESLAYIVATSAWLISSLGEDELASQVGQVVPAILAMYGS